MARGSNNADGRVPGRHTAGKVDEQDPSHLVLAGVKVDLLTIEQALAAIRARTGADTPPLAVASINLDHLHYFGTSGRWQGSLEASAPSEGVQWLNLIDGAPIASRASALTSTRWPRLAGSDLIHPILEGCQERGLRIGFLGGTAETQLKLTQLLAQRRPDLVVAGCWAPSRSALALSSANQIGRASCRERVF